MDEDDDTQVYSNALNEDEIIIQYHEATIKRLEKRIEELMAQPAQEPWRESASDYERGFIDGMQKQAQSSVDKAVNRMAQRPWVDLTDAEFQLIYDMGRTPAGMMEMVSTMLKEKNNG